MNVNLLEKLDQSPSQGSRLQNSHDIQFIVDRNSYSNRRDVAGGF